MAISPVSINNHTQTVRLPESIKREQTRAASNERIISLVDNSWDRFFLSSPQVSEDFLPERASQAQSERGSLI